MSTTGETVIDSGLKRARVGKREYVFDEFLIASCCFVYAMG